jgi:peptide-methionine (S)-S-oxide reductase
MEIATFAGGCFWCLEAVYQRVKGVNKVVSGYMGGTSEDPSYEDVSTGTSGHAEAVQVHFDPEQISYSQLLEIFWHIHNPTTLNRQGNDVGPQYRSAIFYHSQEQKTAAEESKTKAEAEKVWDGEFVTEIAQASEFYPAEDYHQDYYNQNRSRNPYCTIVIDPKISKLMQDFKGQVKEEYAPDNAQGA